MRLVADENVSAEVVGALRAAGYVVWSVAKERAGLADTELLIEPAIRDAIFVTHDRDFGELIFKRELEPPAAVLYVRMGMLDHAVITRRLVETLSGDVRGQFLVIEREKTRQRDLPRKADGTIDG